MESIVNNNIFNSDIEKKVSLPKNDKHVLIRTRKLSKVYGSGESKTIALDDVSLDIYEGEFLVILGQSGCGKSTFLNLISGMDRPSSGDIFYRDQIITDFNDRQLTNYRKDKVSFIFQFFNLIYELSDVGNAILAPNSNKNIKYIKKLFKDLGISGKEFEFPKNLSGGQQQRVAIARALNKDFEVLVCDEPTGALDMESGVAVLDILSKINIEQSKTLILVTHAKEIADMADRVVVFRDGKVEKEYSNSKKLNASEVWF